MMEAHSINCANWYLRNFQHPELSYQLSIFYIDVNNNQKLNKSFIQVLYRPWYAHHVQSKCYQVSGPYAQFQANGDIPKQEPIH